MTHSDHPESIAAENDRALQSLIRVMRFVSRRRFSLVLVRCNYARLREEMLERLRQDSPVAFQVLRLAADEQRLYTKIKTEFGDRVACSEGMYRAACSEGTYRETSALMVVGLEQVQNLPGLLSASNQMRDEFGKSFVFPVFIWVTDNVLRNIIRIAPDFYNWATLIGFRVSTEELLARLWRETDAVFEAALVTTDWSRFSGTHPQAYQELGLARQELQEREETLAPDLAANISFALAVYAHQQHQIGRDVAWRVSTPDNHLPQLKLAAVNLQLGLGYLHQADCHRRDSHRHLQEANAYFQQGIDALDSAQRPDLVAIWISKWGEVLQQLQQWQTLQELAKKALTLHQTQGTATQQAQDYGFLADVALARGKWQQAKDWAIQALQCEEATGNRESGSVSEAERVASKSRCGGYRLRLAQALNGLQQPQQAIEMLERARRESRPQDYPQSYIQILKELRQSYWQQKQYLKAFEIKQAQGVVESQLGLRAFIGASRLQPLPGEELETVALEITASGRGQDVQRLIGRVARDDCKLTVIHGQSGVGKSSLVNAGLVPALGQKMVGEFDVLPIVLRVYTNWQEELAELLLEGISASISLLPGEGSISAGKTSPPAPLLPEQGRISAGKTSPPAPFLPEQGRISAGKTSPPAPFLPEQGRISAGKTSPPAPLLRGEGSKISRNPPINIPSDSPSNSPINISSNPPSDSPVNTPINTPPSLAGKGAGGLGLLLNQLRQNEQRHLMTVLIFDQFEEFFFVCTDTAARRPFFEFLSDCLNLPYLKIILSLREDYLHYLLECERLARIDIINNDILNKHNRYELGDFAPEDAEAIIQELTARSQFHLESELVEQLVQDLAGDTGKVRPIELQIVGAQLQAEEITTLAEYRQQGTKDELVKRYVEAVIKDCGQENQRVGELVLYLLTDEKNTRPLKTRSDLESELTALPIDGVIDSQQLELVLKIFVGSGLVVEVPEKPEDRYQLVHDYLVEFIRQQEGFGIVAQLQAERERRRRSEERLKNVEQRTKQIIRRGFVVLGGISVLTIGVGLLWFKAWGGLQEAQTGTKLERQSVAAIKQFEYQSIEALMTAMEVGQELKKWVKDGHPLEEYPATSPMLALQTILDNIRERNQLQHQGYVMAVAFSLDGKQILTGSRDKTARLWDNQGNLIQELTGHQGSVYAVAFSPDGKQILTGSRDNTARLWDNQGNLIQELTGHQGSVYAVAFSPDGKQILTGSRDNTARLWDNQGNLIQELTGHQGSVYAVAFSPDGKQILTGSRDNTARLWDNQGNLIQELTGHQDLVYAVAFSPDGKQILTGSFDNTARLWDNQGNLIQELTGHQDLVSAVAFSPDGKQILTGSRDNTARLWDNQGKLIQELTGHQDSVIAVAFSPDGKQILTGSRDNTARLWDNQGNLIQELTGHQDSVIAVAFSPDGKQILTGSRDNTARLWDNQGNLIQELTGHQDSVIAVAFSPDGKQILTGSRDNTARLWDNQGNLIQELTGHQDLVYAVAFSLDGKQILTGSRDNTARLWDNQGNLIQELTGHQGSVYAVAFSPDGKQILTGSFDNTARLWDNQGNLIQELTGHQGSVYAVAFSPDGKQILTGSFDNTARLWDNQGNLIQELTGHQDSVIAVAFSPDGKQILTGSRDNTARLWDNQGNLIQELTGHQDSVIAVAFSPDGKQILTGSRDNTARLWDLQGRQIAEFAGYYQAISPDWRTIALIQEDKVVLKPVYRNLDELLAQGCDWLKDYLATHPEARERLPVCRE
jgi:WD40 repeat protein/tetratricopeptide (TPR) repeat protein